MSTAISKQTNDLRSLLSTDQAKAQIAAALPKHLTADRQIRVLMTTINKVPKLLQCSQASLLDALMRCSASGLEPDGVHAHLIPYGQTCTLVIGYKGLLKMIYNSGMVSTINANIIHANDYFDPQTNFHIEHWLRNDTEVDAGPGKVLGAFCTITMKDGATMTARMSEAEINKIRDATRWSGQGPWADHWEEMAKKTVLRRAAKLAPMSAEMHIALNADDDTPEPYTHNAAPARKGISESIVEALPKAEEKEEAAE